MKRVTYGPKSAGGFAVAIDGAIVEHHTSIGAAKRRASEMAKPLEAKRVYFPVIPAPVARKPQRLRPSDIPPAPPVEKPVDKAENIEPVEAPKPVEKPRRKRRAKRKSAEK